mgnify:CR=1 FL=1
MRGYARDNEADKKALRRDLSSLARLVDRYGTVQDKGSLLEAVYPVGCLHITMSYENPRTYFGFGTWELTAQQRAIFGADPDVKAFDCGEEGGANVKRLNAAAIPSHTHSIPALSGTAAAAGSHTHTVSGTAASAGAHEHALTGTSKSNGAHAHSVSGSAASSGAHTHGLSASTGEGGAHNHSVNVYVERPNVGEAGGFAQWLGGLKTQVFSSVVGNHTHAVYGSATSAGAHTHTISGTAASAGAHGHDISSGKATSNGAHTHSVSGSTGTQAAHTHSITTTAKTTGATGSGAEVDFTPAYAAFCIWKRTA